MFFISVFKFVNEKLERIPGDGVFKAAASSPTDSGAGTGSMICTVFGSVDNNNKLLLVTHRYVYSALHTLTSVPIFSILFYVYFLWY